MTREFDDRTPGWRARIGVIAPNVNTTSEIEFNRLGPDGVTFHFTRMPIHRDPRGDGYKALFADLDDRSRQLAECRVGLIAYNCTAGSMLVPQEVLTGHITETVGVPAVATFGAVLDALKTLGVGRVALATPYPEDTTAHEAELLAENGVEVAAFAGMTFPGGTAPDYAAVTPAEIYRHASEIDRDDAEAIFISCCNLNSAAVVAALEEDRGKPVLTSNLCALWAALRKLGIDDRIAAGGTLLAAH